MAHYVYMLTSRSGNALYVGSTSDLRRRLDQHRAGTADSHTARYRIDRLVWFETHERLADALERERRIRRWRRQWKLDLAASINPTMRDLADEIPF